MAVAGLLVLAHLRLELFPCDVRLPRVEVHAIPAEEDLQSLDAMLAEFFDAPREGDVWHDRRLDHLPVEAAD
jgi:hypothetical protein